MKGTWEDEVNDVDEDLGELHLNPLNLESTPIVDILTLLTNLNCSLL